MTNKPFRSSKLTANGLRQTAFISLNKIVLCIFLAVCCQLLAVSASYADPFLTSVMKDGFGVRPMGMGGAFVALSDDSNSVYYNPAGLSNVATQYTRGYLDMNTDTYTSRGCWSAVTSQSGISGWDMVDKNGQRATVTAISLGSPGENGIAWGLTYKTIEWGGLSVPDGAGWTMDAGLKAAFSPEFSTGLLIQDMLKNNVDVATSVRAGAAYQPAALKNTAFCAETEFRDLKSQNGPTINMHYGAEAKLTSGLVVRGGWQAGHFTAGATITMPYIVADYAVIVNQTGTNTQLVGFRLCEPSGN